MTKTYLGIVRKIASSIKQVIYSISLFLFNLKIVHSHFATFRWEAYWFRNGDGREKSHYLNSESPIFLRLGFLGWQSPSFLLSGLTWLLSASRCWRKACKIGQARSNANGNKPIKIDLSHIQRTSVNLLPAWFILSWCLTSGGYSFMLILFPRLNTPLNIWRTVIMAAISSGSLFIFNMIAFKDISKTCREFWYCNWLLVMRMVLLMLSEIRWTLSILLPLTFIRMRLGSFGTTSNKRVCNSSCVHIE